jgi:hypothetical protein
MVPFSISLPATESAVRNMDLYQHVRVVVSILVGFSLTHLLKGVARIVQHPGRERVYWVHLVWAWFMFFYLVTFWWWEFRLEQIPTWTLPLYVFVIVYGVLLYLLCALLFPDDVRDYNGYRDFFYSRRGWFFGVLAALWVVDFFDTMIKGPKHLHEVGIEYDVRALVYFGCSLIAMKTKNARFHAGFAVIGSLYELFYFLRQYFTVG